MSLEQRHADLTRAIIDEQFWGDDTLTDPAWHRAWDVAPRHLFAPDRYYQWADGAWAVHDRTDDPDAWVDAVYSADEPLITQIDADGLPTCSLSAPVLVAAMLGALDLKPGLRVFESGAGIGWTSALMYHRLVPDGIVVSVEYDRLLAKQAQINAFDADAFPVIRAGDGTLGAPDMAPFDRVAATHAVSRIPPAWIAQTKPGGLVCAPVAVADTGLDMYVQLTVDADGSASGPVLFPLAFMRSRTEPRVERENFADGDSRQTKGLGFLDVPRIVRDKHLWVLQLAMPGLKLQGPVLEDGDDTVWLSLPDGSWAVAWVPAGALWTDGGVTVDQYGPQDVWGLAERAWLAWQEVGRPALDDYGLTVASDGTHRLWACSPENVVATL